MKIARRAAVPPFRVMEILGRVDELRAEGRDVLPLCVGEPSHGAPEAVQERAVAAHGERVSFGYSAPVGFGPLREAIAGHHRRWYGMDDDPAAVAVTTGASGAFVAVFMTAFDPGDRVALVRPGYPAYRNLLRSLGIDVVEIAVGAETGFQPTPDALEAVHRERPLSGLVLAAPANPTGSTVGRKELTALLEWSRSRGVRFISDEIYHGITYPAPGDDQAGRGVCAREIDDQAVVVTSFSKYWGMTGWRLGWALLPDDLQEPVSAFLGNASLCAPVPAQLAALGAFEDRTYAECDARVRDFAAARAVLLARLPELGWGPVAPADGAFYLWAGIGDQLGPHSDAVSWCRALLEDTGVALTPGNDFDPIDGGGFVRLSFAAGAETVDRAIDRIIEWSAG